jgi:phosphatidylglycerophosphate synthase
MSEAEPSRRGRVFGLAHALSMAGAAAAAAVAFDPLWFGAGGAASMVVWVVIGDRPWARSELATLANAITGLRVCLCASLPVFLPRLSPLAFTAMVVALLAVDGVDGIVARRSGRATAFGARLDLEADAFLTMMLCLLLRQAGLVPAWVLVAGLWRYFYAAMIALLPARGEEPRSLFSRLSAGVLIFSLASSFLLGARWAPLAAGVGTAVVSLSFARSLYWSYRPSRAPAPAGQAERGG